MRSWPLALLSLTMLGALTTGCASRHIDAAPTRSSAAAQSNATVRKVTYFAAWVDERAGAARATAAPEPALTPAGDAPSDKRPAARSKSSAKRPDAATRQEAGKKPAPGPATRVPQPRYEYTVELDDGSYRTVVGQRDLRLRVNDRVLVQGDSVTAAVN